MYQVTIERRARKALAQLPEDVYRRIRVAIQSLATNPRPPGCKKLVNRDAWRIRVGDYRVIYEIDDEQLTVLVVDVLHRRESYR